jgi:hypothetical protein
LGEKLDAEVPVVVAIVASLDPSLALFDVIGG